MVWPWGKGVDRVTFLGLGQLSGSMKRDILFILGLYPSDSETFLDSCQESQW